MATMKYWKNCDELLGRPHLLIAGSTGSGKSVLINSLLYTLLTYQPNEKQIVLIDPKRVELYAYRRVPHCTGYASEIPEIITLLQKACDVMDARYKEMQKEGKRMYEGTDIYIVIDEFADIMVLTKDVEPLIQRLGQLGRAARVHLIIATQSPNRSTTLKANIVLNLTDRIALHCNDKIESRQIIGQPGAELLPQYGMGIYKTSGKLTRMEIPLTTDEEITERIKAWG